jgi:hypothetical protein
MRSGFLAIIALLLAGCAPMQWAREGASAEQLQDDQRACEEQAYREASLRFYNYYPGMGPAIFQDSLGRRLAVYPSGPFADQFGNQLMEETRLTSFCMRAKGYDLVPAPKK